MVKFSRVICEGGAFMEEGKLVHMTLDGIKKAGSNYGTFPMFHHGGYVMEDATFRFRDPSSPQEISNLEKKLGVTFPNDYKEFLLQHNGMEMFDGINYLAQKELLITMEFKISPGDTS